MAAMSNAPGFQYSQEDFKRDWKQIHALLRDGEDGVAMDCIDAYVQSLTERCERLEKESEGWKTLYREAKQEQVRMLEITPSPAVRGTKGER